MATSLSPTPLSSTAAAALEELVARVRERFGARVVKVALFGSQARGEAHPDSDIDVLVVIDELTWHEAREVDGFVGDILTTFDILLSPFLLSRERYEWLRARERRIIREIEAEGISL